MVQLLLDPMTKIEYPEFNAGLLVLKGADQESQEWEMNSERLINEIKKSLVGKNIGNMPPARAYRDLFAQMGSKKRAPPEEILRRIDENRFKPINPLVDCCLFASVETQIALSIFDLDKIKGDMVIKVAEGTEEFERVRGGKISTNRDELLLIDEEKILAALITGDSVDGIVDEKTEKVAIIAWGAPDIETKKLAKALKRTEDLFTQMFETRTEDLLTVS